MDIQIDKQIDGYIYRQILVDRQIDRQIDKQIERFINKYKLIKKCMLSKGAPKTGLLFAREHLSEYNGFQKNISAANKNCSIWSLQLAQHSNVCW